MYLIQCCVLLHYIYSDMMYLYTSVISIYTYLTYDYDFTYEGAAEEIAGMIYLSPLAFLISEENPFVQEQRNYPIDFVAPLSSKYIVNINLPEGYVVDALPESASVKFNANAASFTYIAKQVGNKIQIMVDTEINQTLITPDQYFVFKNSEIQYLRPDAKSQVTIEYNDDHSPKKVVAIVISTQHDDFDEEDINDNNQNASVTQTEIPPITEVFSTKNVCDGNGIEVIRTGLEELLNIY